MKLIRLRADKTHDSRREETIEIFLETEQGKFLGSAPSGKSKGRYETKPYIQSITHDIRFINKYFSDKKQLRIHELRDLETLETNISKSIGANSLFALESAILKAAASEQKKQVWQILNPRAKKMPYLVGNCIGGGLHSLPPRPVFQEFLCIPNASISDSIAINLKVHETAASILKTKDPLFSYKTNDEHAWQTSLAHDKVLEIMNELKEYAIDNFVVRFGIGIDVAANSFYNKHYQYESQRLNREKQIEYISHLIQKKWISYIEDPLSENDFVGFSQILQNAHNVQSLVVGDDLTVTSFERLNEALRQKSINAIIIKPNQNGSLLSVRRVAELAHRQGIKTVFSHRSGETADPILADLAVAWRADFFKSGILGWGREAKLNRLREIEASIC